MAKYTNAKITSINGEVHISWQTDAQGEPWLAAQKYNIPAEIVQDVNLLREWCQNYKNAYNAGKDAEAAEAEIPAVPAEVTNILNQPLNLE